MASNNYNAYNYQQYQQSSAQQYSGYHTAPAANNVSQPSRRYQQAPPIGTTQATDYMSYPTQSYNGQGSGYGGGQDNLWGGGTNYGGNRETTSRAAEVLRNMSNTAYTPNTTVSATQPGFTATNTATATPRYSTGASQPHQVQQPQHTHSPHPAYGQSQARPRSVNTNRAQATASTRALPSPAAAAGYPSQRAQTLYNQEQHRSASPAQHQYTQNAATPVSSARSAAMTAATQYNDYNREQLPSIATSRSAQNAAVSTSYSYTDNQVTAAVTQTAPSANVPNQYDQNAITVDPMAVYDPWPEYQRKQEALRAQKAIEEQKAIEDAARAEEERKAEEARREEERKKEENARQPEVPVALPAKPKKTQKQSNAPAASSASAAPERSDDQAAQLEAEIRAMMTKMRELNGKDPALLARIWEEERRAKAPKSPTVQSKPSPQPATAHSAQASVPQAANQRKKAVPKETPNASLNKPAATLATPVARPQAQAQTATSARPAGNTIWPPEKKTQLANAASIYLNTHNPGKLLDAGKVLSMLDSNPSYIELCEQLEAMGLKLDRAAFAKNLLTAVPDVNSASRQSQAQGTPRAPAPTQLNGAVAQRVQVPPAKKAATSTPPALQYAPAAHSPLDRSSFPPLPDNSASASHSPVPVAEMVPIKPELKLPANKEEAARKRNFNDLIDLTLLSEDEDAGPPPKKQNVSSMYSYASPGPTAHDSMDIDEEKPLVNNFPIPTSGPQAATISVPSPQYAPPNEFRYMTLAQPLDKKKALRRNTYNVKTIARDVLLACGRHPEERQLNAHLDILRVHLPQVTNDTDLSTIRWDIIDPGEPPKGYFKERAEEFEADDADDESTDDEDGRTSGVRPQAPKQVMRGESETDARIYALPTATNPFKIKRRGRPPRHSYPMNSTHVETPRRASSSTAANMSASAPRPSAASVGYSAFRAATEYGPDGKPLPKKKGRPVGWRKAVHGTPAAQSRPGANGSTGPINVNNFVPSQPSTLRNVRTGEEEPVVINSRSPSVANKVPQYQSFKCKWRNCRAELHNLETLKKHVHKVHGKQTIRGTMECLWGDCGQEVTNIDQVTNMRIEQHTPFSFTDDSKWREHIEVRHFSPLSWELGDGPASGLSDAHDSEAYLSDTQGRRVTPRITVDPTHFGSGGRDASAYSNPSPAPRGRGRPPKATQEQEAINAQKQLVSQKKRVGGPGIDRGGATLVNEKRRKGFSDNDETEEEFVDAED